MNKTDKINVLKARIKKMEGTEKNIKSPGVLKSLRRELRNLENED